MILTTIALILGATYYFVHSVAQRETPPVTPEEQIEFRTALSRKHTV
ncbi:hypothetical protein [Deinococcus sp. PEB2-63]